MKVLLLWPNEHVVVATKVVCHITDRAPLLSWRVTRGNGVRIVTAVHRDGPHILDCDCNMYRQRLLPCRHILAVDKAWGLTSVPVEQVHFRWSIKFFAGELPVTRHVQTCIPAPYLRRNVSVDICVRVKFAGDIHPFLTVR